MEEGIINVRNYECVHLSYYTQQAWSTHLAYIQEMRKVMDTLFSDVTHTVSTFSTDTLIT
jgi:hypothetical protein